MEGKLLWRVIELQKIFRDEQNKLEKQANEAIGSEKRPPTLQGAIYKDAADRLEKLLKELYS